MSIRTRRNKEGKITGYQAIVERGESSTGKRLRDTKTFKTKKEAEAYINQTKSHILNGTYIEPNITSGTIFMIAFSFVAFIESCKSFASPL